MCTRAWCVSFRLPRDRESKSKREEEEERGREGQVTTPRLLFSTSLSHAPSHSPFSRHSLSLNIPIPDSNSKQKQQRHQHPIIRLSPTAFFFFFSKKNPLTTHTHPGGVYRQPRTASAHIYIHDPASLHPPHLDR